MPDIDIRLWRGVDGALYVRAEYGGAVREAVVPAVKGNPDQPREPAGSPEGGQFAPADGGTAAGTGDRRKPQLLVPESPLHLHDHVSVVAGRHFHNMRMMMKGWANGTYDKEDFHQTVDLYHDNAVASNHTRHGRFEAALGNRLEEKYGAKATESPEYKDILKEIKESRDDVDAGLEAMTDVVRAQTFGGTRKVSKGDAASLGEKHDETVDSGHAGFSNIFDAVDRFRAKHLPLPGKEKGAILPPRKGNPDQPRVPAGSPGGGQFAPAGGGSATAPVTTPPGADVATAAGGALEGVKVGRNPDLPPARAEFFARTIEGIARHMPPTARDRLKANLNAVRLFAGQRDIDPALIEDHPQFAKLLAGHKGMYAAAAYSPGRKTLYLDGAGSGPNPGHAPNIDPTYAHEIGHAVDGPRFEFSGTPAWRKIYQEEIDAKETPLSHYAKRDSAEAFAEMHAALYGGERGRDEVERRLPRASAFFREKGLWPDTPAGHAAAKGTAPAGPAPLLAERFSWPLAGGGVMADLSEDSPLAAMPLDGSAYLPPHKGNPDQPRVPAGSPEGGQFAPAEGGGAAGGDASPADEHEAARKLAAAKVAAAPVPPPEKVEAYKAKVEAYKAAAVTARAAGKKEPQQREFLDARGSAADRRRRAEALFREFGGAEKGYVVCHGTGIRTHYTDDPKENPHGYPKFEQGKIFVATQGGGYQLANLLPESFQYNRARNSAPLRKENQS